MNPVNADAATVAADPSQISDSGLDNLPLKFLFAVEIMVSPSPGTK